MKNASNNSIALAARNLSLVASLALSLVGCNSAFSPVASVGTPGKHNDDGGGGSSGASAATSLYLGKIAPLTTVEHQIAGEITVPMGYPVSLRADAATAESFDWRGVPKNTKGMSDEGYSGKSAELNFAKAGDYSIRVIPVVKGQESNADAQVLLIHVMPVSFQHLNIKLFDANSGGGSGDGDGVKNGRGGRIQDQFPMGAAQVAANATLALRAISFPGGFEKMVEWRVDGAVQKDLGKDLSLTFSTEGVHRIEGADGAIEVTVTKDDQVIHH